MITPNQDPSSLKGTMTEQPINGAQYSTKEAQQAAFSNIHPDKTGKTLLGTPIQKPVAGQNPAQPNQPQSFMDMGTFGKAMDEMKTKLGANNDLMEQKKKILMQLYDRPLTDEEKKTLTPSQQSALDGNNRNLIDMEVRLINDTVQGRTTSLDSSVKYLTDTYQAEITRMDTQKKDATDNLMSFIKDQGENSQAALESLYGKDYVEKIKQSTGIDVSGIGSMPGTAAEWKESTRLDNDGNPMLFNAKTGEYKNASGGNGNGTPNTSMDSISAFKSSITTQESGNYSAVNKDSGALGAYQFMPTTGLPLVGLDPKKPADIQKFLNSKELQDQAFEKFVGNLSAKYGGDTTKMAAAYYGGDGAAQIVGTAAANKRQGSNGQYPSINEYVKQVGDRMNTLTTQVKQDDYIYGDFTKTLSSQGQQVFNSLPDIDKSNIKQLVSGDVLIADLVKSRGAQGTKEIERLTKLAQQVDPEFSVNTNKIRYAFLQKWQSSESVVGKTKIAINTALGHLAEVKEMSLGLSPKDLQIINKTKNWWSAATGNPAITNLQFGLTQLATEIATVYKGTGAAPSEKEIETQTELLGLQFSKAQFEGILNTSASFLSSKITASRYSFKSTMGREYEQSIIDPEKRQSLIDAGINPDVIVKENTGEVATPPGGTSSGTNSNNPLGI